MPQVGNIYSLIVLLALLAAGIILFALGQPGFGGLCIGAVLGGATKVPAPLTLKKP